MKIETAAVLALVAFGATACSHQSSDATLAPGTYKTSTTAKDANGTAYDTDTTKNVTVDANGNKTVTTDTKNSTDPKGLFNKSTSATSNTTTYGN